MGAPIAATATATDRRLSPRSRIAWTLLTVAALLIALSLCLALTASLARAQQSQNMSLLGQVKDYAVDYNEVWGYVDEFGNEYALLGVSTGMSVINVSDPATAYETGFFPGPFSIWRDMKSFGDYAYEVTEAGGGMRIFDLSDPENPQFVTSYNGFQSAHNVYIDEANARAYPCGTDTGGTLILDISNPIAPVLLGSYTDRYVHDLYVRDNIAYLSEINDGTLSIIDFSDPSNSVLLGGPHSYQGAFTHNTWLTTDGDHVVTTDELVAGEMIVWDISALPVITRASSYHTPETNAIIHNAIIQGDRAFISYYTEGVRVVDITDPSSPSEIGFYDTWPGASGGFDGDWGVYPFLPSGSILLSDITEGLLIVALDAQLGKLSGRILDADSTVPVADVLVELVETGNSTTSNADGDYALSAPAGAYTLRLSKEGYVTHDEPITITEGGDLLVDLSLERVPGDFLRGVIQSFAAGSTAPVEGASLTLAGTGYAATTDAAGNYDFPALPFGSYELYLYRPGFVPRTLTVWVETGGSHLDLLIHPVDWYDDAESDRGWTLGDGDDTATSGLWLRAIPVGSGNGAVQPGEDATPGSTPGMCFVTGNASEGASIGSNDIDGGKTTLTSPVIDISGMGDPTVAYSRWYSNGAGANPGQDLWKVQIRDSMLGEWTNVEFTNADVTPWSRLEIRILDHIAVTTQFQIRFIADDAVPGSVVEAAVDDVEIYGNSVTTTPSPIARRAAVSLQPNAPNPFNPSTELRFVTARAGRVRLDIHDLRGRRIATVVDEQLSAGEHRRNWRAVDDSGHTLASGVYLLRLQLDGDVDTRKISLAK